MLMKKLIVCIVFISACLLGQAQSHIRINNYWDNLYYLNPASFDNKFSSVYTLAARRQWVNFPGSPRSIFASGTALFDKLHVQLGVKAYQDQIGYTSSTFVSGSYAYAVHLNDNWRINLGLSPSYQSLSYDLSKANVDDANDEALFSESTRENSFNADMGLELHHKSMVIGFSSQNVFSLFFGKEKHQRNTNLAYAMFRSFNDYTINYGFGVSAIQYTNFFQPEAQGSIYFKSRAEEELLYLRLFYRPASEMGLIFGVHIGPFVKVSYSYDFNVSSISSRSVGSHELMLIYHIGRCPTCF